MKELIIVSVLAIAVLFFGPFISTFISYLILFGLFAAIGYMAVRLIIQSVEAIRRNIKQAE